jgi:hypothetical protein
MTDLSPAAQAVLDAFSTYPLRADHIAGDLVPALATALRAAADQVAPRTSEPKGAKPTAAWHRWNVTGALRLNLLSIAAELEGQ